MPRRIELVEVICRDAQLAGAERPAWLATGYLLPITLAGPLLYVGFLLLLALDVWVSLYQRLCFPVCGIPLVRRDEYIVIDRWKLPYLNPIQKANCAYCSYANGLIAYVREIAARTEQYWCPIKHSRPVRGRHRRYAHYADYGDAAGYRTRSANASQTVRATGREGAHETE